MPNKPNTRQFRRNWKFHEMSNYLPILEGEEFDSLVEDIKDFGQIVPATIYEGKILDGRNRYNACKKLNIPLITITWKPSKDTGLTPLQYVISENIMRRHLNEAQKGEIGMLLYKEIAEQVKKEGLKKLSTIMKNIPRNPKGHILPTKASKNAKRENKIKTSKIVAKKVKVAPATIEKVKRIKTIAETNPEIANDWQEVLKGNKTIGATIKKIANIQTTEKLPEPLKKAVKTDEITIEDAKYINKAYLNEPKKQKDAIREVSRTRKTNKFVLEYTKGVITGKVEPPIRHFKTPEEIIVKKFLDTQKQMYRRMTINTFLNFKPEIKDILKKIMRECLTHLQKQLQIKEIINAT